MPDQLTLPPGADPAEVVELGIHEANIKEAALATIVAIQGLGVDPPEEWRSVRAYLSAVEEASSRAEALAGAAHGLAMHLLKRCTAICDERSRP